MALSTHQIINEKYSLRAQAAAFPFRVWDKLAAMTPDKWLSEKGEAGIYYIINNPTVNITALPDAGASTIHQNPAVATVSVAIKEYGEGALNYNGAWQSAFGSDNELATCVAQAAKMGQMQANVLIAKQAINGVGAGTNANVTIGSTTYAPVANGMVYYGTDTVSDTSFRAAITTTDTFTTSAWIQKGVSMLRARGVAPIAWPDGALLYAAMIPPQAVRDLQGITAANSGWINFAYTDSMRLVNGVIGDFLGCRFIEDPLSFYPAAGASSVHVAAMTIIGEGFLATPRLPVSMLAPLSTGAIIPVDEYLQVRITPQGDAHGRLSYVAPYHAMGAGIYDPRNAFRLEFYPSEQTFTPEQLALRAL
jgi:hypothetical protein